MYSLNLVSYWKPTTSKPQRYGLFRGWKLSCNRFNSKTRRPLQGHSMYSDCWMLGILHGLLYLGKTCTLPLKEVNGHIIVPSYSLEPVQDHKPLLAWFYLSFSLSFSQFILTVPSYDGPFRGSIQTFELRTGKTNLLPAACSHSWGCFKPDIKKPHWQHWETLWL